MTTRAEYKAMEDEFFSLRKKRDELGKQSRVLDKRMDQLYSALYLFTQFNTDGTPILTEEERE